MWYLKDTFDRRKELSVEPPRSWVIRYLRAQPSRVLCQDVQVPVCPLCNNPVPVKKGEIPDVVVGEHIDQDCNYHPRKKEKSLEASHLLFLVWIRLHLSC
ncbi:hypothetical protein GH733_017861 [Mirounga leonina]|nr:hypothetical protein GH733_017861 [Mirounga leonina]